MGMLGWGLRGAFLVRGLGWELGIEGIRGCGEVVDGGDVVAIIICGCADWGLSGSVAEHSHNAWN